MRWANPDSPSPTASPPPLSARRRAPRCSPASAQVSTRCWPTPSGISPTRSQSLRERGRTRRSCATPDTTSASSASTTAATTFPTSSARTTTPTGVPRILWPTRSTSPGSRPTTCRRCARTTCGAASCPAGATATSSPRAWISPRRPPSSASWRTVRSKSCVSTRQTGRTRDSPSASTCTSLAPTCPTSCPMSGSTSSIRTTSSCRKTSVTPSSASPRSRRTTRPTGPRPRSRTNSGRSSSRSTGDTRP